MDQSAAFGWNFARDGAAATALDRALDQAEIDRLLGFEDPAAPDAPPGGLSALLAAGAVAGERLPMLELALERLARALPTALRTFTGDNVEVAAGEVVQVRFGDYLTAAPSPSVIAVVRAPELGGPALVLVDPDLVQATLEVLLGGRRMPSRATRARPITAIERALVRRLVEIALEALSSAFAPLAPVSFVLERLETSPRLAAIDRPAGVAAMAPLRVGMGESGGRLEIVLPHATLAPIGERLRRSYADERPRADGSWSAELARGLGAAGLELEAVLAERRAPLSSLLDLKVGDTLPLGPAPGASVELRAGGVTLGTAKLGRRAQMLAVQLDSPVAPAAARAAQARR